MGKKDSRNIKINQKIRHYFDGESFDIGIVRLSTATIAELCLVVGMYDIDLPREMLIKKIRSLWNEADSEIKSDILSFFANENKIYRSPKIKDLPQDKEVKIDMIIRELNIDASEIPILKNALIDTKKITKERVELKLSYIRYEAKIRELETLFDAHFTIDNSFEFNANVKYGIFGETFHKIQTLQTNSFEFDFLFSSDLESIKSFIKEEQILALERFEKRLSHFLHSIKEQHIYLSKDEIISFLKSSKPNEIVPRLRDDIIKRAFGSNRIDVLKDDILVYLDSKFILPYSTQELEFTKEIVLHLNKVVEQIWDSQEIHIDISSTQELIFKEHLERIFEECSGYAKPLNLNKEEIFAKIYDVLLEHLPTNLHISSKLENKTIKRFIYSLSDELLKKQRYELLARTIRDFKNIFPLARSLKRKLYLYIGPTNSAKTYNALLRLKKADTGYYLAPLRLLALEGYDDMKNSGLNTSLITGEEQVVDENASHISSTIEMLDFNIDVDVCVIDEAQMLDDRDRGWAWINAIIGVAAKEVILTASPNTKDAIVELASYLNEELEIVEFSRKNSLTLLDKPIHIDDLKVNSAIVAFSRRDVLRLKERLSSRFSISVLYGNLSPEVRREEARRFREHKSELLIATDAIAMGLNLPIETILFYEATKFDGKKQRQLNVDEIAQIAGRAGRYNLFDEGFVGAMDQATLKILTKNFNKPLSSIKPPFRVMANLEHIKLIANILNESSLSVILEFFVKNMSFNGPFEATNLSDMQEVAVMVDRYNLDIATKYHLSCAPITLSSSHIVSVFQSYLHSFEKKRVINYKMPNAGIAKSADELLLLEDMVKEISLYLWLSYRFSDVFVDVSRAYDAKALLNGYIKLSLEQKEFLKSCKICKKTLKANYNYGICQGCYKKYYGRKY